MKRDNRTSRTLLAIFVGALLLPACGAQAKGGTIKASGTLAVTGDCQILTDGNGHKLALLGKLGAVANGDQITVTGTEAKETKCLQGPTVQVEKAEKIAAKGNKPAGEMGKGTPQLEIVTEPGTASPGAGAKGGQQVRMVHMRGTLNAEGKKCQGFRNLRGDLWVLTGDLKSFKTGDKVEIEGIALDKSDCGQQTVQVNTIQALQ